MFGLAEFIGWRSAISGRRSGGSAESGFGAWAVGGDIEEGEAQFGFGGDGTDAGFFEHGRDRDSQEFSRDRRHNPAGHSNSPIDDTPLIGLERGVP